MAKPVRIVTPEDGSAIGTKVFDENGVEIPKIYAINISIAVDIGVRAEVGVRVGECDIHAHPLLSLESLREAAEAHGLLLLRPNEVESSYATLDGRIFHHYGLPKPSGQLRRVNGIPAQGHGSEPSPAD